MDMTLTVNGIDLSGKLSTYQVTKKVSYTDVLVALDNTEHPFPGASKTEITFSLLPMDEDEAGALYMALANLLVTVSYTDPQEGGVLTMKARVMTDVDAVFLLRSVDGKRRYRGGNVTLRTL